MLILFDLSYTPRHRAFVVYRGAGSNLEVGGTTPAQSAAKHFFGCPHFSAVPPTSTVLAPLAAYDQQTTLSYKI